MVSHDGKILLEWNAYPYYVCDKRRVTIDYSKPVNDATRRLIEVVCPLEQFKVFQGISRYRRVRFDLPAEGESGPHYYELALRGVWLELDELIDMLRVV